MSSNQKSKKPAQKKPQEGVVAEKKTTKPHDPNLPVLQYGGKNHASRYIEWKRSMASSCIKTYGNMGKMFLTLTEYVPPSVAIPEGLNDETDPGG